jgi:pimeloyl-ACP methyl ester carboxylesterase
MMASIIAALQLSLLLTNMPHLPALQMSPHSFPKRGRPLPIPPAGPIDLAFVESSGSASATACTTLLIHGLDSSSHTWRGVQESLPTPSVAIDCRGCGRSALGDSSDFSPDSIVEDIKRLVDGHPLLGDNKFVIVGHSMGGRIGMCYTAKYPGDVAGLVIEDMDIRRRSVQSNFIPNFDEEKAISFDRHQDSMDNLRSAFCDIGYPLDMIEKWIGEGRVYTVDEGGEEEHKDKGTYAWSEVNPAFRALCYRTIFDSESGTEAWSAIFNHMKGKDTDEIALHLMVAGIGTVCDEASIDDMKETMGDLLTVKTYPEGTHSIHNSARDEFLSDLKEVILGASAQKRD